MYYVQPKIVKKHHCSVRANNRVSKTISYFSFSVTKLKNGMKYSLHYNEHKKLSFLYINKCERSRE